MLKDIRELGSDLKRYFAEINFWTELTFNQNDKNEISKIENILSVSDHSIIFKIDENHCIIPSQYVLYAVFIKEFAIALRDHLDVFDKYKVGKSKNDIGSEILSGNYNLEDQNLDEWSLSIGLKPLIDKKYNFDAKSIINGEKGDYKVRGTSDFYTSVILKIINVPDSSSAILGKLIYNLSGDKKLYDYLEKRFYNKLPYLIKEKLTKRFAFKVISYLYQYDKLERFKDCIKTNADLNFKSIKIDNLSLTSIFKVSNKLQNDEELSTGGKIRFFNEPIFLDETLNYYYLSSEWTSGTNSRLDLETLSSIISIKYPEFKIIDDEGYSVLKAINAPSHRLDKNFIQFQNISFIDDLVPTGLTFSSELVKRFISSLKSKQFLILTGLSGSGKTKLAQAFVQWISASPSQYKIIPVGADWTNREPLLGYPNGLEPEKYESPESGALKLLMDAVENPDKPYFMILDEMNLSHVERYFADFLSVMESNDKIKLYDGAERKDGHSEPVPNEISWPSNLFIIGTVNIDETTYMFSPKVLDRANVIEFRIHEADMVKFLGNNQKPKMEMLFMEEKKENGGIGQTMAADFLKKVIAKDIIRHKETEKQDLINKALHDFFIELQKVGAEFGYRTASEIELLLCNLEEYIADVDTRLDIAIMQKLLPKLHGSRKKLIEPLETLAGLCIDNKKLNVEITGRELYKHWNELKDSDKDNHIRFKISFEKIMRMHHNAIQNGYTSYAEA